MNHKKTTLSNGVKVITVPMSDAPAVTVLVLAEAGSKYETKIENGISHFLEHMVFKGTKKRPNASDISRELDSIGAEYNAFTSQEYTGYYVKSDPKHLDFSLEILADMYIQPSIDPKEMEKEKGVIVEEIRMYQDMPQRHVANVFMDLIYGDQPAGWNIAGTESNVLAFTRDQVVDYHRRHYVAEGTTVIVSGAFDEKKIISDLEKIWSNIPTSKKHDKEKVVENQSEKPAIKISYKETDQTHLVLGVRSSPLDSPDEPALKVLSVVLGRGMSSRLFSKLRDEMGVCYYVRADQDSYTDHGIFAVSAGVDNKRVREVIEVLLKELYKTAIEPVGEAELKKVKDYISGTTMLGLETSDSLAQFYGLQEVLIKKTRTPAEEIELIQKVTALDIQNTAKKIFKNKNLNLALIGRFKDPAEFAEYTLFPN